ncbi:hypothetical protein K461DRAFT_293128 [Myriangium duriaei CBS 260.36]|uniref:2EXR domain-containing protein n=1 Tax=Myriangium duriaei CBS 260.36 TaxID=1168546 RepID=A0A9P4J3K8_9PEZI|nr:hypothetical protein K461DRAFT_293128 [Myriangium duriaei CBS 260.36]
MSAIRHFFQFSRKRALTEHAGGNSEQRFYLFSRLPAEIRDQIWHEALPDPDSQSLFFYKETCWVAETLDPSDPDYIHGPNNDNRCMRFQEAALDDCSVSVPLINAVLEARHIGIKWAKSQSLRVAPSLHVSEQLRVSSSFDFHRDVLYVLPELYNHFINQPYDLLSLPENQGQHFLNHAAVEHIALPQSSLSKKHHYLPELLDQIPAIQTLLVVVDPQPYQLAGKDISSWKLEPIHGGGLTWDEAKHSFQPEKQGDRVKDERLYRLLMTLRETMTEAMSNSGLTSFAIQPVQAVLRH